jgi:mono/diheme cytochrome c family protein
VPKNILVLLALSWLGCEGRDVEKPGTSAPAVAPAAAPNLVSARSRAARAQKLFVTWCSGCHGERGRGDGPAAAVITPKPRNFTRDKFKIRSTPTGSPPTRQDLLATVERGLPGTAMPSFRFLSEDERGLIVDHVRSLAGLDSAPEPTPLVLSKPPPS